MAPKLKLNFGLRLSLRGRHFFLVLGGRNGLSWTFWDLGCPYPTWCLLEGFSLVILIIPYMWSVLHNPWVMWDWTVCRSPELKHFRVGQNFQPLIPCGNTCPITLWVACLKPLILLSIWVCIFEQIRFLWIGTFFTILFDSLGNYICR